MNKKQLLRGSLIGSLVVIATTLAACASGPADQPLQARLIENDGRVEFIDARISDERQLVLARAQASYGLQPQCSTLKSGLQNSRRAVAVEDCVYDLHAEEISYAGTPIEQVTYRFVDDRLFQMQFVFKRASNGSSSVEHIGNSVTGDLKLSRTADNLDGHRWHSKRDVIEIMEDTQVGTTALRISDARLLDQVIAGR